MLFSRCILGTSEISAKGQFRPREDALRIPLSTSGFQREPQYDLISMFDCDLGFCARCGGSLQAPNIVPLIALKSLNSLFFIRLFLSQHIVITPRFYTSVKAALDKGRHVAVYSCCQDFSRIWGWTTPPKRI